MKTQKINWKKFDEGVNILEKKLRPLKTTIKNIYGIPRGGLCLAVALSHKLDVPLVIDQRSISKNTLIVDDISDSGETLLKLSKKKKTKLVATLFTRKGTSFIPDYTAFNLKNHNWIQFSWESDQK